MLIILPASCLCSVCCLADLFGCFDHGYAKTCLLSSPLSFRCPCSRHYLSFPVTRRCPCSHHCLSHHHSAVSAPLTISSHCLRRLYHAYRRRAAADQCDASTRGSLTVPLCLRHSARLIRRQAPAEAASSHTAPPLSPPERGALLTNSRGRYCGRRAAPLETPRNGLVACRAEMSPMSGRAAG